MSTITKIEPYRGNHWRITVSNVNPETDLRFRNFKGAENNYNKLGDRNFKLCFNAEDAEKLRQLGMYIPYRESSRSANEGSYILKVAVSYRFNEPAIVAISGDTNYAITEKEVGDIDDYELIDIPHISLITSSNRYNDTEIAHLDEMHLVKRHSDFREKYASLLNHRDEAEELPFNFN